MDRLASITTFVCVAEARSFAAAATRLGLSATMVANHIRELEAHLGARLIERTTRRHRLTDVGVAYLARCRDVLSAVQAADGVAEAARTRPEGLLRVSASISYGSHRLTPVIADYCLAYPGVQVELDLNDRVVDIEEEGFHAGVRSGNVPGGRLIITPLRPPRMWLAASPGYLDRCGTPACPADLIGHACLAFTVWGPDASWRFSRDGQTETVPVRGPLTVNNGQGLLQAALAGLGLIVQADLLLEAPVAAGQLVRLLVDWELPVRPLSLVTSRRAPASAKLTSFVAFVRERLG